MDQAEEQIKKDMVRFNPNIYGVQKNEVMPERKVKMYTDFIQTKLGLKDFNSKKESMELERAQYGAV